jgi:hypothetical protein
MAKRMMVPSAPRQQVLKMSLKHRYFLRIRELITAPIVPKRMRKMAAIEISKSDAPNGLMSRFAVEAKV